MELHETPDEPIALSLNPPKTPYIPVGLLCEDDGEQASQIILTFLGEISYSRKFMAKHLPGLAITEDPELTRFTIKPPPGTRMSRVELQLPIYRLGRKLSWRILDQKIAQ